MKIMHICIDYNRLYHNLMEKQIEQGVDLKVFHYTIRHREMKHISDNYVHFYNSSIKLLRSPIFFKTRIRFVAKQFYKLYKESFDFELVHAHMLFSDGEIAYKAYKAWGTPYIVAIRNNDMNSWYYWRIPRNKKRGFEILKNAKKVVFLSPAYKFKLINILPHEMKEELNNKALIIPNGIENFWHLNARKGSKPFPNKKIRILTVGSINLNKNQLTVVKAIKLLRDNGYKVEYTVVGNIEDKKVGSKLGIEQDVKILPYCTHDKLIKVYEDADVFVLPSIHETFGLVYAEAMSQGLPVIYSRGEGFDQQFPEGEVGLSVNCADPEEISNAIIKIVANYETISERCISASKEFDWELIAKKYLSIYNDIVTR